MSDKKQALSAAYVELASALTKAAKASEAYARELGVASTPEQLEALVANPPNLPFFGSNGGKAIASAAHDKDNEDGKKKRKVKKIKDPNAPKRPASAYIEYQNAVRETFRNAEPELAYQDILKKISAVWQAMPDDEKKTWNDITAAKTAEWEELKRAYKPAEGLENAGPAIPALITVGKDGKEYAGKKRGRKSNAQKALEAADAAASGVETAPAPEAGPSDKKKSKAVSATPKSTKKQKELTPPAELESDSDSDSDDSSESEESEEDVPPPPPVKKSPASKKGKAPVEEKHKSKKVKH